MEAFLKFIYTGGFLLQDELIPKLFEIAAFYEVQELKSECEKILQENLTAKVAVETLIFAEKHDCKELKKDAMEMIKEDEISLAESALSELMNFPTLVKELIYFKESTTLKREFKYGN